MRAPVRLVRVVAGFGLLLAGALFFVLPGPGLAMAVAGLLLLETEFRWARVLRQRLSSAATRVGSSARAAWRWALERAAYGLALLPVMTDWVDTGHWPQHPREFVTEIIVGLVILLGVWSLHRRAERYRTLSQTDPLTGLGNRARFRVDLEGAVARAQAGQGPVVVGIVDVDRFKAVNDTFGHAMGDRVLREVGVALGRSVRDGTDGCYRLGGDEFAVLVTGAGPEQVLQVLRRGFARASKALGQGLSCSVGIVAHRAGEGADAFVHRADRFMYAAKKGGAAEENPAHSFGRLELGNPDAAAASRGAWGGAAVACSGAVANG